MSHKAPNPGPPKGSVRPPVPPAPPKTNGSLDMRDQQLKVEVENGRLSISIGVDILSWACEMGRRDGHDIVVTNKDIFAEGVAQQLKSEEEDGTTLVHKMFDDAVSVMIENGEHGADLEDE